MAELYGQIHLEEADRQAIEAYLLAELERIEADKARHIRSLTARRTSLEDQRRQLLQAHYAGAVPLELLKEEQDRLTRQISGIQRQLDGYQADATLVRQHLAQALDLLEDCARLYTAAPEHLKKQLDRVFFQRVLVNPVVDEDGQVVLPADPRQPKDGPERTGHTTPATHAAGETGTAGSGGAASRGGAKDAEDAAADRPTNRSEVGAAGQQTTRRGTGATGHHAAHQPAPTADTGPVFTQDPEQHSTAAAILSFPFDQLASPGLRQAAYQHASTVDADPSQTPIPGLSGQRKTPTAKGEHHSSSEMAPATTPLAAGSYSSTVVRLSTFDTKNWRSLLRFRERLLQRGWTRPDLEERPLDDTAKLADNDTTPPPEQSTVVRRIIHIENRPISREKRAAIRREANGTLGARAVAERHGVHENTVRAIWRQRPGPARRGPHRFTPEHRQRAEVLVAQGVSLIDIGLELGFDRGTVRRHLSARGNDT
ncbi:hypothetical protein MANAM107_25700 [Actinomyces capricornis]|uniref:Uncharacterized protein n=1 Tax=Actinomyces capricornis TaxID=2755559 RepID=A0ABM7UF07_9ACTO|nr:hypothetical protein MANAM107_25700 [Actinomyces capricornis]